MALTQLVEGQAEAATQVNENFVAVEPASCYGRRASTTNLLTWGYYGGNAWVNGALATIADGTVALTASNVNYIEASASTGAVSANIVGFTSGALKLYTVTTDGTGITAYTDYRFNYGVFSSVLALPTFMGALVKLSGDLTGQNYSTPTVVPWTAEEYDTHAFHDNSTNNSRITIPADLGITRVELVGQIRAESVTSTSTWYINIRKNGAAFMGAGYVSGGDENGTTVQIQCTTGPISVSDGDYFELQFQCSDTSINLMSNLSWFGIKVLEATRLDQHRSLFSTIASSSGALTVNLSGYEYFKTTLTENVTSVTMSGVTTGVLSRFELRVAQDGTGGRTWANPASWKFPGGTAYTPSAAASAVDILRGRTYDDGTTWEVEFQKGYA